MLRLFLLNTKTCMERLTRRKVFQAVSTGVVTTGTGYIIYYPNEKQSIQSSLGSVIRFMRSVKIGLTISLDYWIAPMLGYTESEVHQKAADRILQGCLQNGGIFIKLGQGLAAVNHILPKEYVKTLSTLQDKCLMRESNELEEMFLQDFGKKPEEVFKSIDTEPIAAASLAQVFKGETMHGDTVAVKVQYIDLQSRYKSDMRTLDYLLRVISLMHPKFDLHWVVDELFDTLRQELDFEIEGKNGEKCAEDLKGYSYAYVPKVYWDLSTKRILTTEWIDGIKINDIEGLKKEGFDIADVDKKLVTLMAEQVFHTGFVHADPHPGNILVRKGHDNKAQIVLLDHGLYEILPEKARVSLCNFWESIVFKNDHLMKTYARDLNAGDHIILYEILTQAPYSISLMAKDKPENVSSDEYMKKQAQERFDQITIALRAMPKNMMLVIRNLNTIRSIAKEHGDTIDRYTIMARIAVRGRYQLANQTFRGKISGIISKVKFETCLWTHSFTQWLLKIYLNLLQLMGYDVKRIMHTFAVQMV
ncbi:hypothetical protein KM043_009467 [Ampulex compressa]|nr:hypothetical protein KM043_009467 [Ampulex compressa]